LAVADRTGQASAAGGIQQRDTILAVVVDEHLPVASSGEVSLPREGADEHE
jgi:hypothetical protein